MGSSCRPGSPAGIGCRHSRTVFVFRSRRSFPNGHGESNCVAGVALRDIEHFTCIHKHSCAVLKCVAGVGHRDMQHFSTISLWIRRSRLGGHGVRKCVAGVALRDSEHFTSVVTHPLGYHSHPFTSTLWGAKMRGRRGTS